MNIMDAAAARRPSDYKPDPVTAGIFRVVMVARLGPPAP